MDETTETLDPAVDQGPIEVEEGGNWQTDEGLEAGGAILYFVFEEPWKKHDNAKVSPRMPTEAIQVSIEYKPGDFRQVFGATTKNCKDLKEAFVLWLDEQLEETDPIRYKWKVSRFTLPEIRFPDSSRTFKVSNQAYREGRQPETGMTPMGSAGQVGLFSGPSPLGLNPGQPISMHAAPMPGITGNLESMMGQAWIAQKEAVHLAMRTIEWAADTMARQSQAMAQLLAASPHRDVEIMRMQMALKERELELANDLHKTRVQETSGIARELGGRAIGSPATTAVLMGIANHLGISPKQVTEFIASMNE